MEGTPLMAKMTLLLIEQVLRDMAAWRSSELSIDVSINLSAENLSDRGFIDCITGPTRRCNSSPAARSRN
ncbi:hypothetical protein [Duganella sp. BK701]|uniref:hypothetical protein n=1 Tax=Duganella sp. BK701 TaxID=2512166 RepID=UPI001E45144F|nr:hypothetical protein [Duganella sp. BK701]